jgi:peptidoglycan/xylan/chitin deacetylase (PgdA/CDA1 family)
MGDRAPRWPVVVMYHGVGSRPPDVDVDNLFVPADVFRAQLDAIAQRGLRPVSLDEVDAAPAGDTGPDTILITFDDAHVSTLDTAAPMLAERGWPAVVFVASQTIGGVSSWNPKLHEPLLDVAGLHDLRRLGFAIGAHSRTHPDLRGLPAATLRDEVHGSADDLDRLIGVRPRWFAYPYGHHDAAAREAVRTAGYAGAFAVHAARGRYGWPRVDINALDTARTFALKLRPVFPIVRRSLGVVPPLRRAAHRVAGYATRSGEHPPATGAG